MPFALMQNQNDMAGKTMGMHQIKQIIELSRKGKGIREIVRLTGIARNTVRDYLRKAERLELPPESLVTMEDEPLEFLLQQEPVRENAGPVATLTKDERFKTIEAQLGYYTTELRKRGVTRYLLWEEYRKDNPDSYRYTQFCEYIRRYLQRNQAVMHFDHKLGEQMQVDFAGDKLHYVDRETGEVIPALAIGQSKQDSKSASLKCLAFSLSNSAIVVNCYLPVSSK